MIVNNIQPCPKLCLLMPLARVGARRGQFLRTRVGIVNKTRRKISSIIMRRGFCTLGLFIITAVMYRILIVGPTDY